MRSLLAQTGWLLGDPEGPARTVTDGPVFTADEVFSPYIWVAIAAFLVTFAVTPILRLLAVRNGVVDWPDLKRKAHAEPVAYLGGVGIFLGWLVGVICALFFIEPHGFSTFASVGSIEFPMSIVWGAAIICVVGLIDDVYGISPRMKVGGQLMAAALLASETVGTSLAGGVVAPVLDLMSIEPAALNIGADPRWADPTYWIGALFVMVLVLGGCNALNLLDGLDGLATGVTAICMAGFLFVAVALAMGVYGDMGRPFSPLYDPVRVVMCLAVLGALMGFLPYNFNPANIFMGDAGSLLLGYLSVTTILLFAEKRPGGSVGDPQLVMAGLIIFAVPILDTTLALVRRKMRGASLFSPDNQHLHHQLVRSGLSVKQAVFVLYAISAGFAIVGASLVFVRMRYVLSVFLVIFGFIVVMAYKVGHRQYLALQAKERGTAASPTASVSAAGPAASDTSSPEQASGAAGTQPAGPA